MKRWVNLLIYFLCVSVVCLSHSVQAQEATIIFIGDSITEADGTRPPYSQGQQIVGYQEVFRQHNLKVTSYGVSGATYQQSPAHSGIPSLYDDLVVHHKVQLPTNATKIVLLGGTNDIAMGYSTQYSNQPNQTIGALKQIIQFLKANFPQAQFYLCSPPYTTTPSRSPKRMEDLCTSLKKVASELKLNYIDLYHEGPIKAANADQLLFDGVHPNQEGHLAMGQYLYEQVTQ
ncbi:SGNH/GDSL hydrolase family protein [Vaginisenegalia massiliensis]|uniref:SGNH/GDSL hydrolase family protein n=1 Tax=Vaginisenegalia massiliensis TaxID=2058294 RepID=UPI000F54A822|nr:SGNH/GDSL hydrolase family protein [Vaginisenegalia massiliensis]